MTRSGRRPLNYSTTVDSGRSADECVSLLREYGADHIALTLEARKLTGLAFRAGGASYVLPVNVDGAEKALHRAWQERRITGGKGISREQAERVAWRTAKDWLEVQLTLIEAGMKDLAEVMLPYLLLDKDTTLYQAITRGQLAIGAGP